MDKIKLLIACILTFLIMILSLMVGYLNLNPPIPATGPVGEPPEPDSGNAILYFIVSGFSFIALIIFIYKLLRK